MPGPDGRLQRDPVSELFDGPARRLLERAYATPGQWVNTRVADPSPAHVSYFLSAWGINVLGADNAPTISGRHQNMRSRWCRAFARSVFYNERWYGGGRVLRKTKRMVPNQQRSLVIEVGNRVRQLGVIPAGRAVRIRTVPGGPAAYRAVQSLPERDRIFTSTGQHADRAADPPGRDW